MTKPAGPTLVVLHDSEARVALADRLFGPAPLERLAVNAAAAGFRRILLAPGVLTRPEALRRAVGGDPERPVQIEEVSVGEALEGGGLAIYEGTLINPKVLELMVEHPLEQEERFSLYDGAGRPSAWFFGELERIPPSMPMSEEIAWPPELGPGDLVRVVYKEDRDRAEALVRRLHGVAFEEGSRWQSAVEAPSLRFVVDGPFTLAQTEFAALGLGLLAGAFTLVDSWGTLVFGCICLVASVHLSRVLMSARVLLPTSGSSDLRWAPGERLSQATRPLAHAFILGSLTYVMVSQTTRSGIAALVLLAAGAGAVLLSLLHARTVLRGRDSELAIPRGIRFFERMSIRLPPWLVAAPILELCVAVSALSGLTAAPWSILIGTAIARLWRWFIAPPPDPSAASTVGGAGASAA